MPEIDEFKTSGYEYGLTKILGVKVKEVHGYITNEFDAPTFQLTQIELEDGTKISCEGEHDMPYLAYNDKLDEMCERLYESDD